MGSVCHINQQRRLTMYRILSLLMIPIIFFSLYSIAAFYVANNYTEGSMIAAILSSWTLGLSTLGYTLSKC